MATLTIDDLAKCHMREVSHLNGGKEWFGYIYSVVEHPRLSRMDKYTRKDRCVQSTWRVDGEDCHTLAEALVALDVPPTISADEIDALKRWRDDFDGAWRDRAVAYGVTMSLAQKGLIDGKRGITDAGRAAIAPATPQEGTNE